MPSLQRVWSGVVLIAVVLAGPAVAQERAWIDVNAGVATAAQEAYSTSVSFPFRQETATAAAGYGLPTGAFFDVGGGWMFHPRVGAGISVAGAAHEETATLSATIPHPLFFDLPASATASTADTLTRSETAIDLQVMAIVTPPDAALTVRVFAGPTHFRVRQDTVNDVLYQEAITGGNVFSITITDAVIVEEDASGWGFHAGADVRYLFTPRVGVGAIVRVSRGEMDIAGIFGDPTTIDTGGVQIGGGLRLKF